MAYYYEGAEISAPLTIQSNEPIYEVDTVSLTKQRASQGAQRWELSFSTTHSAKSLSEAETMIESITNIATSTTMVMPQIPYVVENNTCGVSLPITVAGTAGGTTVTFTNDGSLRKGSFIKFSNHDKIYMVLTTRSAGTKVLNVYPTLRQDVAITDTVQTGSSAVLSYYRDIDNLRGLTFTDGLLSSVGTISLIEAL